MPETEFNNIQDLFKGSFLTKPEVILEKMLKIKAFVFDWDGVFNNGFKDAGGSSPFNEVDSMGINMLRYNYFMRKGTNPVAAIISGEKNEASFTLAKREHFQGAYFKIKNKKEALHHLCNVHAIEPHEVAFFFDDILDLSIAELCGLRIMIGRDSNPMFTKLVKEKKLADYITSCNGGDNGIREAVELLIGLTGQYNNTIMHRVMWSDNYRDYITERDTLTTTFYTLIGSEIIKNIQ